METSEKRVVKDYMNENSVIINDLKIAINRIENFFNNANKELVEGVNKDPTCFIEEIKRQNDDLKTLIEKSQRILNSLY